MTDSNNEIEAEFEPRGQRRGGVLFLTPDVAIEMVQRCREKNVNILGIDAFRLTQETTQPVMDESIDYTTASTAGSRVTNRWQHAETFLRERSNHGLHFEVVCG